MRHVWSGASSQKAGSSAGSARARRVVGDRRHRQGSWEGAAAQRDTYSTIPAMTALAKPRGPLEKLNPSADPDPDRSPSPPRPVSTCESAIEGESASYVTWRISTGGHPGSSPCDTHRVTATSEITTDHRSLRRSSLFACKFESGTAHRGAACSLTGRVRLSWWSRRCWLG